MNGTKVADGGDAGRRPRFFAATLAAIVVALVASASARAHTYTVGSPLAGTYASSWSAEGSIIGVNTVLPPGALLASPVDGTVVRWRGRGQFFGTADGSWQYRLVVIEPSGKNQFGDDQYTVVASSDPAAPIFAEPPQTQTFPTSLPISAGDLVGLAPIGDYVSIPAAHAVGGSALLMGGPLWSAVNQPADELGFNADVQTLPTVSSVTPATGPAAGGTTVTVVGTGFEGEVGDVAVSFGAAPATSFSIDSETQITAVAPPGVAEPVDVTVTTLAGTSAPSEADRFVFQAPPLAPEERPGPAQAPSGPSSADPTAPSPGISPAPAGSNCVVPRLIGLRLKAARTALRSRHCRVGAIEKRAGVTAGTGRTIAQHPAPGSRRRVRFAVALTLALEAGARSSGYWGIPGGPTIWMP